MANLLPGLVLLLVGGALAGLLAAELGPRAALLGFGAAMLALVALVTLVSDVVRME